MNELIKIETNNNKQVISGRELYQFLEIGTRYNDWIKRLIDRYNFIENEDFITITQKRVTAQNNKIEFENHLMIMSMAKEISMIVNTDKGREARKYFIKCEEAWNSPEMILARANQIQAKMIEDYSKQITLLENKIIEQQPKVNFYDTVTQSETHLDFEQVSKLLNYKNVGRNTLFKILRDNNILTMKNFPYQKYVELEYFKLVEGNYIRNGEIEVYLKTVVSQKGIEFIDKLLSDLGYIKKVIYNEDNSN